MTAEDAVDWGWTGPVLRACGVPLRRPQGPSLSPLRDLDFKMPVSHAGDIYARYLVRVEEMRQSLSIVEQALSRLEPGPVITDDHHVALPAKDKVYTEMESLIWHFKLIMEGMKVPPVRPTATPRAPTASSASTPSPTAAASPTGSR